MDETELIDAFEVLKEKYTTQRDYKLVEEDVPLLCYVVASTTCVGIGYETVINAKIFASLMHVTQHSLSPAHYKAMMVKNLLFSQIDETLLSFTYEFARELRELSPISKLEGIGANKWSRIRLPDLTKMTLEYCYDLEFAVDELLEPG